MCVKQLNARGNLSVQGGAIHDPERATSRALAARLLPRTFLCALAARIEVTESHLVLDASPGCEAKVWGETQYRDATFEYPLASKICVTP